MNKNIFNFIFVALCLLDGSNALAVPIRHLVLDLDETVIQRAPEYISEDGTLKSDLEPIKIEALYPDGTLQKRTYFLRPGIRNFLEWITDPSLNPKMKVSFLSFSHQARLNAVLQKIELRNRPLIDLVYSAFGSEAVTQYYSLKETNSSNKIFKDLTLVDHPQSRGFWSKLKTLDPDLSVLKEFSLHHIPPTNDILLLDDKPQYLDPTQRNNVITIAMSEESPDDLKKKSQEYALLKQNKQTALTAEFLISQSEVERLQYKILKVLFTQASTTQLPNNYQEWQSALSVPQAMSIERSFFKEATAALVRNHQQGDVLLFLGRDSEQFYFMFSEVIKKLKLDIQIHYLPVSRLVVQNHFDQIPIILKNDGIPIDDFRKGSKKLRIVDTGFAGSVPKAIIKSLIDNNADWRTQVKQYSAFLFTTPVSAPSDLASYRDLDQYLNHGAFVEEPVLQSQFDKEHLRSLIQYMEVHRPHTISRPDRVKNGVIQVDSSHPTEVRATQIYNLIAVEYGQRNSTVKTIESEIENKTDIPWRTDSAPDDRELTEKKPLVLAWDIKVKEDMKKTLGKELANAEASFVPHRRPPGNEKDGYFEYQPKWFEELDSLKVQEKDLEKNRSLSDLQNQRLTGVMSLSRSAQGKHNSNSGKLLSSYGSELSKVTITSNQQATELIFNTSLESISTSSDLEKFILKLADIYLEKVSPAGQRFRTWTYDRQPDVSQSADQLEKDWHWFVGWLYARLQIDYNPVELGAQIHYMLTHRIHPFYDSVGKVARDLVDFVYLKKGYQPPDWSQIKFETYTSNSTNLKSTRDLLLKISKKQSGSMRCDSIFF